jgi:hypothetical protein
MLHVLDFGIDACLEDRAGFGKTVHMPSRSVSSSSGAPYRQSGHALRLVKGGAAA